MKQFLKDWCGSLSESERNCIARKISTEPDDTEAAPKFFHAGQLQAWRSEKRFVLVVAGTQSGKTTAGVHLLLREIARTAKPNEENAYMIVGPETELLKKKALPEFARATKGKAEYKSSDKCFVFTPRGAKRLTGEECDIRVFVGYAHDPNTLEAATLKGVWADECGQDKFRRESWEALQRRAAVNKARVFFTTTPYLATGWLRDLHDDTTAGRRQDAEVVNFKSTDNPRFTNEEFDRMKRELPDWKFRMFCLGEFTRPAGAVFDCFDRSKHVARAFTIPGHWPRNVGVDFGETNTAAVCVALDPDTGRLFVYDTYHTGGRTVQEHVTAILRKVGRDPEFAVGGSWGEDEWRKDYIDAGLPLARPNVRDVEVGIQRVYRQIKEGKLQVFDTCEKLVSEIESYSRELDDRGEPLDRIRDKAKYHRLDALRYIVSVLRPSADPSFSSFSRLSLSREPIV